MEKPRQGSRALTVNTFLALFAVALGVGIVGGAILLSQIRKTCFSLQLEANRQQAVRLTNILEGRMASGVATETILKEFQMGLEMLPKDDSGYYCLIGNGGKLLCHPNPKLLGIDLGKMRLVNQDSEISFNSIVSEGTGHGGTLTLPGKTPNIQIVFSQPVKGTNWQVNVHSDSSIIDRRVSRIRLVVVSALMPSLLALIGIGTFAVRRVAQRYETQLLNTNAELEEAIAATQKTNQALALAQRETEREKAVVIERNHELDRIRQLLEQRNVDLDLKVSELEASNLRADRIFSALAKALPGTTLDGKYRLDRAIGNGGFGAVFEATQINLGRPVAVKVFRPAPGNDSAAAVERFRREAITTSRVSHPNAITVLDSNVSTDGIPYLVMELLKGKTVREELESKGRFPLRKCSKILSEACGALFAAHNAGVIHRDIKPENIFLHQVQEGETVKVLDFGIARLIQGEDSENLTEPGLLIGTPAYMAPERIRGESCGAMSDVYALGVVAYEMLCGRKPFPGPYHDLLALIELFNSDPPSIRTQLPHLSEEIEDVVMRAISRNPDQRPTVAEFAALFSAAASRHPEQPEITGFTIPQNGLQERETPTLLDASGLNNEEGTHSVTN